MSLSNDWLDQLRDRTTLSALIGKTLKLRKKGGEFEACCPFHSEKTPSFTVNDAKAFYHCFGCGAHGDAIRWLTDQGGLPFIDAVKELAAAAGMDVPAPSPQVAHRDAQVTQAADVLDKAASWYVQQLQGDAKVRAALADRGITPASINRFGLGFAPARKSVAAIGVPPQQMEAAGLLVPDEQRGGFRDRFRSRVMIPIHDQRGRMVGFAGRLHGSPADPAKPPPKYINSPDSPHFDKGDLLFNLHRAAPAARSARRLIIVEGQLDTIALDQAGIEEVAAPGGTALTERQLERAWRIAHCPILLMDADNAGAKAALRAAERAMPHVGPGKSLAIAQLPPGEDPDSLARAGGREAIEAVIASARPLSEWLFDQLLVAA